MKNLVTFLLAGIVSIPLCFAQTQEEPKFLDDAEVTRLNPKPEWEAPTKLNPAIVKGDNSSGYQTYVYCNDRLYVSGCMNGNVYWYDLKNDRGLGYGARQWAYTVGAHDSHNIFGRTSESDPITDADWNRDNWGRGFTSTGKYLIQYRIREDWTTSSTRQDLYPISEFLVVEPGTNPNHHFGQDGRFVKRIKLTQAQFEDLANTVGGPADISSYGDIMSPEGGYIVLVGVKTTYVGGKANYQVIQKLAKINFSNGNITGIQYFDVPEINTGVRQIFLKGLSANQALVNIRSNHIGIYDFTLNGGKGGWLPNFQIASGFGTNPEVVAGRGFNLGTTGFCAFKMQGPKATKPRNIFLFPTGGPNYTEKFTGYDIDNYRWVEGDNAEGVHYAYADYSDCYYYAPGVNPSYEAKPDKSDICCTNLFNNFLYFRQDPNDKSLGYVYQVRPNTKRSAFSVGVGNTIRCYHIQILPREEVFKVPAPGMTTESELVTGVENDPTLGRDINQILSMNQKVKFHNATVEANLNPQLTVEGYHASLYEYETKGYATTPVQSLYNAKDPASGAVNNEFLFTDLRQPYGNAYGYWFPIDYDNTALSDYKVVGHVHYKWYGQVSFKSPDVESMVKPDYPSDFVKELKSKIVWVPSSSYKGDVTPAKTFALIDFMPTAEMRTTMPVSYYEIYESEVPDVMAKPVLLGRIPGDFDFDNKPNLSELVSAGTVPASHEFPYVHISYLTGHNSEAEAVAYYKDKSFTVIAIYAPKNLKIGREVYAETTGSVITGVENVGTDNTFAITPTLVDNIINITNNEAITNIEIYSVAGALVKQLQGNNNTYENVIVDDLAKGVYFVKVNNNKPVKIVKR